MFRFPAGLYLLFSVENLLIHLRLIRKMTFTQKEHPGLLFLIRVSLRDQGVEANHSHVYGDGWNWLYNTQ